MTPAIGSPYEYEVETWRTAAERSLRAEDGWLTLVGLFWLQEGANRVGSDEDSEIVLPASLPAYVATIEYHTGDDSALLHAEPAVGLLVNKLPATEQRIGADLPGPPDFVSIGDVTFFLIKRGNRMGVRVRDKNSAARREFQGRRWFPVREEYLVEADFSAYDPPRPVAVTNILGDTEPMTAAGYASFVLGGRHLELEAMLRGDGQLFFIFRDQTSGRETYPAARFLVTPGPEAGKVALDFNRAYSPPCAFTPYATCPLPPERNHLPLRIEAGELYDPHH